MLHKIYCIDCKLNNRPVTWVENFLTVKEDWDYMTNPDLRCPQCGGRLITRSVLQDMELEEYLESVATSARSLD